MASNDVNISKSEMPANAQQANSKAASAEKLNKMTPDISPEILGLKVLVQPAELDDVDIDIVAVHGIGVNPEDTWIHKKNNVNWLSEPTMLPSALPKARIMVYNYMSYWYGDNAVKQTVSSVAGKLLYSLRDERDECSDRPILFIGHCFGGLVIQEAYNIARMHPSDHPTVANSLAGMIFLGTPHHGVHNSSALTTQGQIYKFIAEAEVPILDDALRTMAQDNEKLVDTVHNFTRSIHNQQENKPKLFCFWESKNTPVGAIIGMRKVSQEFVVSRSSATLNGHDGESLDLNHFNMNKFGSHDDNNYRSVRRQILDISKASKSMISSQHRGSTNTFPLNPRHHIPSLAAPIAREAHFAERQNILKLLEDKFRASMHVVLQGDSGNGKTHVAVEYAHMFHKDHPDSHVHWVNAASAPQFELSYKRIGENLHISRKVLEKENVVDVVYDVMQQDVGGQWLMILDGLDDEALLKTNDEKHGERSLLDFVPSSARAMVLTTTRSKTIAMKIAKKAEFMIDVSKVREEDASFLLYEKHTKDSAKIQTATTVSKALGGSAGTLILARVYKSATKTTWKNYLASIREADRSKESDKASVRAWQLVYEIIKEKDPSAAQLLLVMGSLNVQSISTVFFHRLELKLIEQLVDYGMVEPSTDRRFYTVTPLIRRCVQTWLTTANEKEFIEGYALSVMCDKFPADDYNTAEVLLPCALAMLEFQPASLEGKRYVAILLFRVAQHYVAMGRKSIALDYFNKCLSLQEKDPEAKADAIEATKRAIEQTNGPRGHLKADVEPALRKSPVDIRIDNVKEELRDLEVQGGETSHEAIRKASDLANLQLMHGSKDHQDETVGHYERSLQWYKDKEMNDTIDTARLNYNLALALEDRGDLDRAMSLYQSASETMERHLGPNHPELLRIHGNIACMYCSRGQTKEAKRLFGVILQNQQKVLGIDHPETLVTRGNIALMLEEKGELKAARAELEKIMSAQLRLRDDPATLRTACSLAMNYRLQGKFKDARKWFEATLDSQEKLLGKNHRDTVTTRVMLAELPRGEEELVRYIRS